MELHFTHLEWRGVVVAHHEAYQPTVVMDRLSTGPIRHASRLNDRAVKAHVIDHANEAVVQDFNQHAIVSLVTKTE
jgi:hypothetical protein